MSKLARTKRATQRSDLNRRVFVEQFRGTEWKTVTQIVAGLSDAIKPEVANRFAACGFNPCSGQLPLQQRIELGKRRVVIKLCGDMARHGILEMENGQSERRFRLTAKGRERYAKQEAQARSSTD